jgi:hypothetical protein
MRDILEGAITALLNSDKDRATELFHKYLVDRARQIHESYRQGDAFEMDESWDEEIKTESYFTAEDLNDLEGEDDLEGGDVADDADLAGDVADLDGGDDFAAGDFGADEAGEDEAGDELAGDLTGDDDLAGEDAPVEERLDDLEAQVQKMVDEFEELMAVYSDDEEGLDGEADLGGEDDLGAEDGAGDFGGEDDTLDDGDVDADASFDVDAPEDDMEDDKPMEDEEMDDFDDITESIIDELEKVSVTLDGRKELDGTALPAGETGSPVLSQKPLGDASPITTKSSKHNGFARETAPSVADMKKRRNTKTKGTDGQESVSKEGDASAELNKLKSEKGSSLF